MEQGSYPPEPRPAVVGSSGSLASSVLDPLTRLRARVIERSLDVMVDRPILGMSSLVLVSIVLASVAFVIFPFDIDTTSATFIPRTSDIGRLQETLLVAEEDTRFNPFRNPSDFAGSDTPQQSSRAYGLTLIYSRAPGDNVLTPDRLDAIKALEEVIKSLPGYESVCLRGRNTSDCLRPTTLTSYAFATPVGGCSGVYRPNGNASSLSQLINTTLLSLIDPSRAGVFCEASSGNCSAGCLEPSPSFLDFGVSPSFGFPNNNASQTPVQLTSDVTKTEFYFGLPLAGYANADDRYDAQIAIIENFVKLTKSHIDAADGNAGLTVGFIARVLLLDYFFDLIFQDVAYVALAIVIVGIYMSLYMQSVFLASCSMLHILLSFPIAYLFTQAFMDFGPMGVLNLMALFIILGIGADDVFIFTDMWTQSAITIPDAGSNTPRAPALSRAEAADPQHRAWLKARLRWTWRRAVSAMFITSLTTGAAFVMNLSSDVTAIQIFGAFTALMIFFNFVLVVTYYPMVVMVYERYIQFVAWPCCPRGVRGFCATPAAAATQTTSTAANLPTATNTGSSSASVKETDPAKPAAKARNVDDYRPLESFFYNVFGVWVYRLRWPIIAVFAAYFGLALGFATQLEASKEPARYLPDDDKVQQTLDINDNRFARQPSVAQIKVAYGLRAIDLSNVNIYNPDDVGQTRFDPGFDPSSPFAQTLFIDMCSAFRTQPFVLDKEVLCPMEEFRNYVVSVLSATFPVPAAEFVPLLANFTAYYEATQGPAPNYSGATAASEQDPSTRENRAEGESTLYQTIRFDIKATTPTLRYMAVIVNTTLGRAASGAEIRPMYDHWGALLRSNNNDPAFVNATLDDALQTCSLYVDMQLEQTLLEAAIIGIGASLALGFVIIVVLTQDVLLSLMAITSIGGVVASLIGAVVWLGWTLSLIESVSLTILVGLSVDYSIHLSHAFQESKALTRELKVRDALLTMGSSVLSAAVTTMLSASVLLATYIIFFYKFGLFVLLTVLYSSLWAFCFFMALCAVTGRIRPHNDLAWAWRSLTAPCRSGSSTPAAETAQKPRSINETDDSSATGTPVETFGGKSPSKITSV